MSRIADLSKVRSPEALTVQSGPLKSKTWLRTMKTVEGSCGFMRKVSEKCGNKVGVDLGSIPCKAPSRKHLTHPSPSKKF